MPDAVKLLKRRVYLTRVVATNAGCLHFRNYFKKLGDFFHLSRESNVDRSWILSQGQNDRSYDHEQPANQSFCVNMLSEKECGENYR